MERKRTIENKILIFKKKYNIEVLKSNIEGFDWFIPLYKVKNDETKKLQEIGTHMSTKELENYYYNILFNVED